MFEIGDRVITEWHEIPMGGVVIDKNSNRAFYAVRLDNDIIVFRGAIEMEAEKGRNCQTTTGRLE